MPCNIQRWQSRFWIFNRIPMSVLCSTCMKLCHSLLIRLKLYSLHSRVPFKDRFSSKYFHLLRCKSASTSLNLLWKLVKSNSNWQKQTTNTTNWCSSTKWFAKEEVKETLTQLKMKKPKKNSNKSKFKWLPLSRKCKAFWVLMRL